MKLSQRIFINLGFILTTFLPLWAQTVPQTSPTHEHLVWEDDFSKDTPGLPDATKWDDEYGYVRNHEAQFYTRQRLENARIENGCLVIEARKDNYPLPADLKGKKYEGKTIAPYTSASLNTLGKAEWLYGRIEIRAKMPAGKGTWPALWTLGTSIGTLSWPKCGEIDLLEMFKDPHRVRGNFHYAKEGKHVSSDGGSLVVQDSDKTFHTYVLDWKETEIDLSVDGKQFAHLNTAKAVDHGYNPYQHPHYLIMNLALGGVAGGSIDDTAFPQRMEIASVKVYQNKP